MLQMLQLVGHFSTDKMTSEVDTLGSEGGPLDFCRFPNHFHGMIQG